MKSRNPFAQPAQLWEARFELHQDVVPALEEVFAEEAVSTADFELDEAAGTRRATILLQRPVDTREIRSRLALIEAMTGREIVLTSVTELQPKDWVNEVKQSFPPLSIGHFYIHGSHVEQRPPHGATALLIDANAAFGTGEHETTKGCLLALERLCKQRRPGHALDMGCGSAILAMAAAKRWHIPTLGVEIDAVSVEVARRNVALNRLTSDVRIVLGDGYRCAEIREQKSFDLIFANILARPLVAMAPQLARHLAPGGTAILSGLLTRQENMVLHAHRQQGLRLRERLRLGAWSVLVMEKAEA